MRALTPVQLCAGLKLSQLALVANYIQSGKQLKQHQEKSRDEPLADCTWEEEAMQLWAVLPELLLLQSAVPGASGSLRLPGSTESRSLTDVQLHKAESKDTPFPPLNTLQKCEPSSKHSLGSRCRDISPDIHPSSGPRSFHGSRHSSGAESWKSRGLRKEGLAKSLKSLFLLFPLLSPPASPLLPMWQTIAGLQQLRTARQPLIST